MVRSILVPLDGSPSAEHALPVALSIARKSGATVHIALVHVPDAFRASAVVSPEDVDWEPKAHEQAYLDALRGRMATVFSGDVEIHHLEGLVEETLVSEVARRDIDLVVMNAHGWGYVARALVGSISEYLVRHVTVPLLMMHAEAVTVDLAHEVAFHRILIPLDGSKLAETILEPAAALGKLWQAEFHLLRVVPWAMPISGAQLEHPRPVPRSAKDENIAAAEDYLNGAAQQLRNQAVAAQTQVAVNRSVAAAVLDAATSSACDLIAISTHGRGGIARLLLGSVASKVLRAGHAPVLVYRPARAD